MARDNSNILPFPNHIDRDIFGAWFSGFTDGEGCFGLNFSNTHNRSNRSPQARFRIGLRKDDSNVLKLIQSYFGIGCIEYSDRKLLRANTNPSCTWYLQNSKHCLEILVPHFERFPLFAKKQRDFEIWKQGVKFIESKYTNIKRHSTGRYCQRRWSDSDLEEFGKLIDALRETRKYTEDPLAIPEIAIKTPNDNQILLFDIM